MIYLSRVDEHTVRLMMTMTDVSLRASRSTFSVSDWLMTKNNERVVELLEDKPDVYNPDSSLWKLKTLYYSCLDDYSNMRTAGTRMVKLIGEIGTADVTKRPFNAIARLCA